MKKLILVLLLLLLSPLLLPLFALLVGLMICVQFYSWLWLIKFRWTHADRIYLICSRRRGWDPLLKNNVIPALPARVTAVWLETPQQLATVLRAARSDNAFLPIPFLILVTPFGIQSTPLNQRLLPLKYCGKTSAETRKHARSAIEDALSDFSQWYLRD